MSKYIFLSIVCFVVIVRLILSQIQLHSPCTIDSNNGYYMIVCNSAEDAMRYEPLRDKNYLIVVSYREIGVWNIIMDGIATYM